MSDCTKSWEKVVETPITRALLADVEWLRGARLDELLEIIPDRSDLPSDRSSDRGDSAQRALSDIAPQDETERELAIQMIAMHLNGMNCLRLANLPRQHIEYRNMELRNAERFFALHAKLAASLDKHRRRGQQKVTVEYVHVSDGGQAIVGNVTTGSTERAHEVNTAPETNSDDKTTNATAIGDNAELPTEEVPVRSGAAVRR